MNARKLFVPIFTATAALAIIIASLAIADTPKDSKSAAPAEMKLPPGWTESDMKAAMLAGTPGKEHELLAEEVGVWNGNCTMWMYPGADPMSAQCTYTVTSLMDGRYFKGEFAGEMPGMGPFNGLAIRGFDNQSHKFVSTWIDNHSTEIISGVGQLSADGKILTWNFTYTCPVTNKPTALRHIETSTGPNNKTLEIFGTEPKSGKEFQAMKIEYTRK
jgi:hypothetical protein